MNFFRLLSIHLFYDNVILNSKLKSNEYLFLDTILKLENIESNDVSLRLTDVLKILRRYYLIFRSLLLRIIEVYFFISFILKIFTLLKRNLFISFSFIIKYSIF